MRHVKIFSGNSHPSLTAAICERLGTTPAKCELTKFSNGETSVSIGTSIRDQDVFIVQSGSKKTNDSVMELLIMISACKGGSAKSITAVMPYFPYSRQSKKKSHRGAITARVLANLLSVAGIDHVITVDLHAPPMQGFFSKPVDNLHAEPIIARWIRHNVECWRSAVVVAKNAGGSKRVTSLADSLKLNFGIITTDRRRSPHNSSGGTAMESSTLWAPRGAAKRTNNTEASADSMKSDDGGAEKATSNEGGGSSSSSRGRACLQSGTNTPTSSSQREFTIGPSGNSPLHQSTTIQQVELPSESRRRPQRSLTAPGALVIPMLDDDLGDEEYTDERAREVITGRLVQGHIVDDDWPSPMLSTMSNSGVGANNNLSHPISTSLGSPQLESRDPMLSSFISTAGSSTAAPLATTASDHPLGGTYDAALSEEEYDDQMYRDPEIERTVTLVGNVNQKTVLIIDDIIDKASSWIAAAETVVKRGGATKVYCLATHALFGEDSLEELEKCDCIDYVVVCNTFPIDTQRAALSKKLVVLNIAGMLSEAIRRNHFGESISQLYQHYQD